MCLPLLFLPAAQCFTLYILHFLPVLSPNDGYPVASHFSQTMLWWKSLYTPLLGLFENFFGINLGAELPVIRMHTVYLRVFTNLLSIMARAVYTPTSNAWGFLYYTPHSRSSNPWIYPYIWTHILLSPLLDCKLLKGRVYVVYLCIVHYALLVLF